MRQTAALASIIKSADHGLHWTRSAADNYARPMFPGSRFGAPFFITYGKNGAAKVDDAEGKSHCSTRHKRTAPWGPWNLLFTQTFQEGYYNPAIAAKFGPRRRAPSNDLRRR
jgi:hypothetical protein